MPLTSLAPELILLLQPLTQQRDLSSLSRTCKRLRKILLPSVYQSISWEWNIRYRAQDRPVDVIFVPPIQLLLRSLIENPDLGTLIEHIYFQGTKYNPFKRVTHPLWDASKGDLSGSEMQIRDMAIDTVTRFRLVPLEGWHQALADGDVDAYIALALALMPNLHSLALGWQFTSTNSTWLGCLFARAFPSELQLLQRSGAPASSTPHSPAAATTAEPLALPEYKHLRVISLGRPPPPPTPLTTVQANFQDLYPIFSCPSLSDVTIQLPRQPNRRDDVEPNWLPPADLPIPSLPQLTNLTLAECQAPPHLIARLLGAHPPLQRFRYDYLCAEPVSYAHGFYFDLQILDRILRSLRSTLREVVIAYTHEEPDIAEFPSYAQGPYVHRLGGFADTGGGKRSSSGDGDDNDNNNNGGHDYPNLESVEMDITMLVGWDRASQHKGLVDVLPRSLKHLRLRADVSMWLDNEWTPRDVAAQVRQVLLAKKVGMDNDGRKNDIDDAFPVLERVEMLRAEYEEWFLEDGEEDEGGREQEMVMGQLHRLASEVGVAVTVCEADSWPEERRKVWGS